MDLGFARRRSGDDTRSTDDLDSILARVAARQAASATARVLHRAESPMVRDGDPRITLFAAERHAECALGAFATLCEGR